MLEKTFIRRKFLPNGIRTKYSRITITKPSTYSQENFYRINKLT